MELSVVETSRVENPSGEEEKSRTTNMYHINNGPTTRETGGTYQNVSTDSSEIFHSIHRYPNLFIDIPIYS